MYLLKVICGICLYLRDKLILCEVFQTIVIVPFIGKKYLKYLFKKINILTSWLNENVIKLIVVCLIVQSKLQYIVHAVHCEVHCTLYIVKCILNSSFIVANNKLPTTRNHQEIIFMLECLI